MSDTPSIASVGDVPRIDGALRASWSADTSYWPDTWTPERPSIGQCAVTALIVQDQLGGDIIVAEVADDFHFWNRLPDGTEVDLTRD
jgi:hypothetical protein